MATAPVSPSMSKEKVPKRFLKDCNIDKIEHKLGDGSYGTVFAARTKRGEEVAVKVLQDVKHTQAEFIPHKCNHENVISISKVWVNPEPDNKYHACLIMQLCHQDLYNYMDEQPAVLDVGKQHKLKMDIMCGLEYLHRKRIVHRDLKPRNILMIGQRAKLADFGLSKLLPQGKSYMGTQFGTLTYMAPEILQEETPRKYWDSVDIWASGKVFLFISVGPAARKAINKQRCGLEEVLEHRAINQHGGEIQDIRSKRLIMHMMMKDHTARPSAREVLQRLKDEAPNTTEVHGVSPLFGSTQDGSSTGQRLSMPRSQPQYPTPADQNYSRPLPPTHLGSIGGLEDSNSRPYAAYQDNIPRSFLPQDSSNRRISYPGIVVTGGATLDPQTGNIVPNTDMFCLTNQGEWIPESDFDLITALPLIAPIDRGFAALGGYAYGNQMMTTQIYDVNRSRDSVSGISVSSTTLHANISTCRHAGLVESQGVLYAIGGVNENKTITTEVKKIADSQWVPCQSCPLPIAWPIVTSGEGLIYIIENTCAYNQHIRNSQTPIKMYMYNTLLDHWHESTQLRQDILSTAGASLIFHEGFLYLLGGEGRLCERFSTVNRGWVPIPEKPQLPHGFAPCVLQQDSVFLLGGYGSQGTIEKFSLVTGKWTVWDVRMPKELVYHSATIV